MSSPQPLKRQTSVEDTLKSWKNPKTVFELQELLGVGSYGSVHKAKHKQTGETVAVKIIEAESDAIVLKKEIEILKNCNSNYIVSYRGTYRTEDEIWVSMEYCHGGSISDLMAIIQRKLKEEEISVVCHSILQGLMYLHKQKLIHRDVKAGNVLLNKRGDIKLADFGVSAQLNETVAKRCTVIGTPYWMAPEVLTAKKEYDYKADIWSLGVTAFEMATGSPPYADIHPMRAIFMIPTKPSPKLPDGFGADFNDFINKCLKKNPDQRPNAETLLDHPFVKGKGDTTIMHELVHSAMPDIMTFRDKMSEERKRRSSGSNEDKGTNKIKPIAIRSMRKGGSYSSLGTGPVFLGGTTDSIMILPEGEIVDPSRSNKITPSANYKTLLEKKFEVPNYLGKVELEELVGEYETTFEEEKKAVMEFYSSRIEQLKKRLSEL